MELDALLTAVRPHSTKADYRAAIIDDNVLAKNTHSTRRLTAKRLGELYGLDPSVLLFRVLRHLWDVDGEGRALLACLCANVRDPLLRLTSPAVLNAPYGQQVDKQAIVEAVAAATGARFNPSTRDKIARNAASSWTQSGHLTGRSRKLRTQATATPASAAYALLLGHLAGARGAMLFQTYWAKLLDAPATRIHALAFEASRRGWIDYRRAGDVVEIGFRGLLSAADLEVIRE